MRSAAFALAVVATARLSFAQSGGDVVSAAAAFEEGQRAQLSRDFARAAEMFELADRAAPSPAALRSAIRNRQAAGHMARAATLAARARARDAGDPQSAALATEVLDALTPRLGRITLRCAPACAVLFEGRAVSQGATEHELFVEPGSHALEASWTGRGSRSAPVDVAAGATATLSLDAPPEAPPPPPPPAPAVVEVRTPPPPPPAEPPRRPLPSAVFWTAAGATVVAGAVLVWSAVDTLSARDAYVAAPTEAGYTDGVSRQTRTNALIATTATLAAATVVTAFFTDFRGRPHTAVAAAPLPGGAAFGLTHTF